MGQCCRIFIKLNFLPCLADLGKPGYTCNCLRLLSQNSFEDVRVENIRCNQGFTVGENNPLYEAIFHQHQPTVSMHLSSFAVPIVSQIIVTFYHNTGRL